MQKEDRFFMMYKTCSACSLPSTRFHGLLFSCGRLFVDNALQFLQLLLKKLIAIFLQSRGKFSSKGGNKTNVLFYNKPLNYLRTSSEAFQ